MKRFCFIYLKFIVSSSLPRFLNCVDKLHSLLVTFVGLASLKINRIKNHKLKQCTEEDVCVIIEGYPKTNITLVLFRKLHPYHFLTNIGIL